MASLTSFFTRRLSQQSRHKTRSPKAPEPLSSIVVTHPFHPLSGETLLIAFERRDPVHERLFVCEAGPARRVALPLSWTDRATDVRLAHRLGPKAWPRWPNSSPHCKIHWPQHETCHDLVWQWQTR